MAQARRWVDKAIRMHSTPEALELRAAIDLQRPNIGPPPWMRITPEYRRPLAHLYTIILIVLVGRMLTSQPSYQPPVYSPPSGGIISSIVTSIFLTVFMNVVIRIMS